MLIARFLYALTVLLWHKKTGIIKRHGIRYKIDLNEAVGLSLFLFGNYQKHIIKNKSIKLSPRSIIFDVGANFGVFSLQFAKLVPSGKVYAFEPTHYAFSKLEKNLQLNPKLKKRIFPIQAFVSSKTAANSKLKAFSSWRIDRYEKMDVHPVHHGIKKPAQGVGSVTLDDFCKKRNITNVDFIKIDTDGHELKVLYGAKKLINRFRPIIIFEVGIYLLNEQNIDFAEYMKFFAPFNYRLFNAQNGKIINIDNYLRHIPLYGTIDILAVPA